jgi:hypothetical protein
MDKHKLGVIVPYRDRADQLGEFRIKVSYYLKKNHINHNIFIIEQDNAKLFNRGMLLNIGFKYALENECDYVVFHDIDMIPIDVDYSYSDIPLHLATDFELEEDEKKREIFSEYFGGVTLFPVKDFQKINGYSNKYWGWGYEDTDLLLRCKTNNIELDTLKIENKGKSGDGLKFNGIDSYVECDNIIDLKYNATFFISFCPENVVFDHTKESDEFTVFSIPGWDFAICYNSFSRYNFCAFDSNYEPYYVNSEIKPAYKTNIVVVLNADEKYIKVYQDGELIGQTKTYKKLYFYRKEPKFYLGIGKPGREKIPNLFRGTIDSFAYFDDILSDEEIKEISNNKTNSLSESFGDYKSNGSLKLYYDADYIENYELIDLTGGGLNGKIVNCEIVKQEYSEYTEVKVPHRRKSLFKSLKHDENGFLGNKWKDQATRWNQLRFHNEVSLNHDLMINDGLSDLNFVQHGYMIDNKIHQAIIGI